MPGIAIFHPTDPLGHVPGGIDTIIRGILKWAPPDLEYTLFGATTDNQARPVGQEIVGLFGNPNARYLPLTTVDAKSRKGAVPLTLRYVHALRRHLRGGHCDAFGALDFHRMEPMVLFRGDKRPKNVIVHQDMTILKQKDCDILWRHAPWLYARMERWLFSDLDCMWCVRQTAADRYREQYPKLASRIHFMPTWVDTTVFHPGSAGEREAARSDLRSRLAVSSGTRVLVTVGRLDRQKDPLLLLEAFQELRGPQPDTHLVLIGDGVLRSQVEERVVTLGLKGHVTLLGVLNPQQIARVLRGSDVFVLSSAYEGMPIAVLEALACGVPVACSDVGEVRLVVTDGLSGAVAQARTPTGLARSFQDVISATGGAITPASCARAVEPYQDIRVLSGIYANHRRQLVGAR
jgi:glycosyltransferase involved in cell wall biosynthesis